MYYAKEKTNLDTLGLKFETKLYKGVRWIPVSALGVGCLTDAELEQISQLSPINKRKNISTLYDAIKLLQVGNFKVEDDNITCTSDDGLTWEHHKSGKLAVESNCGCCATVAAWICYILGDKYDEVGILSASSISGNGHVINYIIEKRRIYIIDAYAMTNKFVSKICPESGKVSDFCKSIIPTSCLLLVDSFSDFANFFAKYMFFKSKEYLFFKYLSNMCPPIAYTKEGEKTVIILPDNCGVEVIKQKKKVNIIDYRLVSAPQNCFKGYEYPERKGE